jgi:plastocyanin
MKLPYLLLCFLPAAALACSSTSSSPSDGGLAEAGDAASTDAAADGSPADAGADGTTAVNGCTEADFAASDHTAAADPRIVQAPNDALPVQFTPQCMRVKVGQTITWQGDLAAHPISYVVTAASGVQVADASSLFVVGLPDGSPNQNTGTMGQPGTIAFKCDNHPTVMFGAVQVVP